MEKRFSIGWHVGDDPLRRSAKSPAVAGLDLSLRCPAVCVIPEGWKVGDWKTLRCESFPTDPLGYDVGTPEGSIERIDYVIEKVRGVVGGVERIFVEQYAFSRSSSSTTKLAELGGAIRWAYWVADPWRVLRTVTASQARKLLLGKLPQKGAKVAVQAALYANGAPFKNDDECDAYCIANFGLSESGYPHLTLA